MFDDSYQLYVVVTTLRLFEDLLTITQTTEPFWDVSIKLIVSILTLTFIFHSTMPIYYLAIFR